MIKEITVYEGNEIIALFDGWSKRDGFDFLYKKGGRSLASDQFKYHSSWDWLMPVVEKINKLNLSNIEHNYSRDSVRVEINVGGYCEISAGGWWDHEVAWEQQLCYFNSYNPELGINGQPPLIEKLWNVTVQFIQWYTTTPKSNP